MTLLLVEVFTKYLNQKKKNTLVMILFLFIKECKVKSLLPKPKNKWLSLFHNQPLYMKKEIKVMNDYRSIYISHKQILSKKIKNDT
jgi:hypothetical protein